MDLLTENNFLLIAQAELPTSSWINTVVPIGIIALVAGMIYAIRRFAGKTMYDLSGNYGGGGGLSKIFRHKRLKRVNRDIPHRGQIRSFEDRELARFLDEGNLKDASKYLTGVLNAAKQAGDQHTMARYEEYLEELIRLYDEKEQDGRGGKAIHLTK